MALILCSECGREISDKALACPGCGAPTISQPCGVQNKQENTSSAMGIVALCLGLASTIMPYFAAVFLVPAALVCGIIAFRRGQKILGGFSIALAMIGLIGIIAVSQKIESAQHELDRSLRELERSQHEFERNLK